MRSMRPLARLFLFLALFPALAAAQQAAAQPSDGGNRGQAWIIPIRGDIEPSLAAFARREARKALSQGVECLIFEIDTFGGRVDSALQIASFIMSVKNARTVAWVNNSETSMGVSWSAGALIAFSCADIYMAPGTSMGAAAPVSAGPDGSMQGAGEKSVAAVRSQMAALAERNGHPVGLALAMVDYDVELWEVSVDGAVKALALPELERLERDAQNGKPDIKRLGVISPEGKLLSLTAGEALRYGLAAGLADSRESLVAELGVAGEIIESSPSAADGVISFLTSGAVQAILILLGLVMIFLELQSPGFGIPGATALIAFLVVFGSSFLLGRVSSLEILLFLIGLGLLAVEIFVTPGFGLMGISGFIIIGFSLVLSMQDFVVPRFDWEWTFLGRNVLVVFVGLLAAIAGIAVIALLGPKIRIFDGLTLKTKIVGTAGGPDPDSPLGRSLAASEAERKKGAAFGAAGGPEISAGKTAAAGGPFPEDEENYAALVGKIGVADSTLRPSGKAVFDGKVYSVEADGEFVDSGRGVAVIRVRGNRIIVKRV